MHSNAWIQILDENGQDVYHDREPKGLKKKYTPIEIVNLNKYKDEQLLSTIYAGGKKDILSERGIFKPYEVTVLLAVYFFSAGVNG